MYLLNKTLLNSFRTRNLLALATGLALIHSPLLLWADGEVPAPAPETQYESEVSYQDLKELLLGSIKPIRSETGYSFELGLPKVDGCEYFPFGATAPRRRTTTENKDEINVSFNLSISGAEDCLQKLKDLRRRFPKNGQCLSPYTNCIVLSIDEAPVTFDGKIGSVNFNYDDYTSGYLELFGSDDRYNRTETDYSKYTEKERLAEIELLSAQIAACNREKNFDEIERLSQDMVRLANTKPTTTASASRRQHTTEVGSASGTPTGTDEETLTDIPAEYGDIAEQIENIDDSASAVKMIKKLQTILSENPDLKESLTEHYSNAIKRYTEVASTEEYSSILDDINKNERRFGLAGNQANTLRTDIFKAWKKDVNTGDDVNDYMDSLAKWASIPSRNGAKPLAANGPLTLAAASIEHFLTEGAQNKKPDMANAAFEQLKQWMASEEDLSKKLQEVGDKYVTFMAERANTKADLTFAKTQLDDWASAQGNRSPDLVQAYVEIAKKYSNEENPELRNPGKAMAILNDAKRNLDLDSAEKETLRNYGFDLRAGQLQALANLSLVTGIPVNRDPAFMTQFMAVRQQAYGQMVQACQFRNASRVSDPFTAAENCASAKTKLSNIDAIYKQSMQQSQQALAGGLPGDNSMFNINQPGFGSSGASISPWNNELFQQQRGPATQSSGFDPNFGPAPTPLFRQ